MKALEADLQDGFQEFVAASIRADKLTSEEQLAEEQFTVTRSNAEERIRQEFDKIETERQKIRETHSARRAAMAEKLDQEKGELEESTEENALRTRAASMIYADEALAKVATLQFA